MRDRQTDTRGKTKCLPTLTICGGGNIILYKVYWPGIAVVLRALSTVRYRTDLYLCLCIDYHLTSLCSQVHLCLSSLLLALNEKIENSRWVSFDIKFTRQGFENACWHREASRAIQHAFSKPSLANLISKDANLVFYLSVYPLFHSSN